MVGREAKKSFDEIHTTNRAFQSRLALKLYAADIGPWGNTVLRHRLRLPGGLSERVEYVRNPTY
jgi:hypothetical protein